MHIYMYMYVCVLCILIYLARLGQASPGQVSLARPGMAEPIYAANQQKPKKAMSNTYSESESWERPQTTQKDKPDRLWRWGGWLAHGLLVFLCIRSFYSNDVIRH